MSNSSTDSSDARRFLTLAVLAMAVMALLAELWLRHAAPQRDIVAHVLMDARTSDAAGVILGDSHTFTLGTRLPGFVNLSLPGANVPSMAALAALRRRHARIRTAILGAGPELFSVANTQRGDGGLSQAKDSALLLASPPMARRLIPSLFGRSRGAEAEMAQLGVGDRWDQVELPRREIWTSARVRQQLPAPAAIRAAHMAAFRQLITTLQAAGTQVCLVHMPVTPRYLREASRHAEYLALEQQMREMAHQLQLTWIDYREMTPPLDLHEFLNQDHLNDAGAARFAPWLYDRCTHAVP